MHYVKSKDKRTGITYVYESESYWDKEKKQPRAHRKLIGRLDEETGEIVPTDGRGRRRKDRPQEVPAVSTDTTTQAAAAGEDLSRIIQEKDEQIRLLMAGNEKLRQEKAAFLKALNSLVEDYMSQE